MTLRPPLTRPGVRRPAPAGDARDVDVRLARLHLRGGLIALARAELETMAGQGTLDRPALADLAEVRWRGGDLVGAGEAAQAHLDAGGDELMALIVHVEALEARGHGAEARALAARVAERAGPDLDDLLAGQRRAAAWPRGNGSGRSRTARRPGRFGLLAGGSELAAEPADRESAIDPAWAETLFESPSASDAPGPRRRRGRTAVQAAAAERPGADPRSGLDLPFVPAPGAAPGSMEQTVDVGLAAGRELEVIEELVEHGELATVAERLGLLLRIDRALAPVILSLADRATVAAGSDPRTAGALDLLRGDAYRILGREREASQAYERSSRALRARPSSDQPRSVHERGGGVPRQGAGMSENEEPT